MDCVRVCCEVVVWWCVIGLVYLCCCVYEACDGGEWCGCGECLMIVLVMVVVEVVVMMMRL